MEDFVLRAVMSVGGNEANQGAGIARGLTRYGSGTWELTRLETKAVAAARSERRGMRGCIVSAPLVFN